MAPGECKRLSFEPTTATRFRLLVTRAHAENVRVAEFQILREGDEPLLRPGLKWWAFKSGNRAVWDYPKDGPRVIEEEYPGKEVWDCRSGEVLDLSARMAPDGKLSWDVPAGRWTILRFGSVLVGEGPRMMSRALKGGFESDVYSPKAADKMFDSTLAVVAKDSKSLPVQARRALAGLFLDSYEVGASVQGQQGTWT